MKCPARCQRLTAYRRERIDAPRAGLSADERRCDRRCHIHCPNQDALVLQVARELRSITTHQRVRDGLVVPQRAVAPALEAIPDRLAVLVVVANDRSHVVQLVGRRDQAHRRARVLEVGEVVLFPLLPRQLVFGILDEAVAASEDNLADRIAEARADLRQRRLAAAVFRGIMQQRPDCLVLVGAVLHGDRRNSEDVSDVGNAGALAPLALMDVVRVRQCGRKPCGRRQRHSRMIT